MASTANPNAEMHTMSPKDQFLAAIEKEHQTTLKVLNALPRDKSELTPHPKCRPAREMAWSTFVGEMGMGTVAITTGFDWSNPPQMPPAPASFDEVVAAFDQGYRNLVKTVKETPEEKLMSETVQFPVGPGQMHDWPKIQFLWFMLMDQIHHRGQFSIYLRVADAKVPSIYGPSADEPWF